MDKKSINREILLYIEKILAQYDKDGFDEGHRRNHIEQVINNSIEIFNSISDEYEIKLVYCYVIAAYHDIGIPQGREMHHINSANILRNDKQLKEWFDTNEISLMAEAIEDHRASLDSGPRTIYGAIVSEADRDLRYETVILRTIQYGKKHYSQYADNYEYQKTRTQKHLQEKYGDSGYVKLPLNTKLNRDRLKQLRAIINDEPQFENHFKELWDSIR